VKSRISSKGQITVPVEVRDALGLSPGTPVEFVVREGEVVIRKGLRGADPVDVVYGKLPLRKPVDAILDEMRGPRPARHEAGKRRRRRR
jgi:AbrB family looped-hinge helix DNA binding protein